MPETPPQATSTPTASHEDDQLDQAAQGNAAKSAEPSTTPQLSAQVSTTDANSDVAPTLHNLPTDPPPPLAADANSSPATTSDVDPQDSPRTQQHAAQQPQPTASTIEGGNAPIVPPAAPSGQSPRLMTPSGIPLARGPDGRLYNPAKGEPPRKDGPKAQPNALLKPDRPRTYGDSASRSGLETGDSQERSPGITGLSDMPKGWPRLPSSVSLSQEIAWVQSERLLVVKETPGRGIKVDLSKARVPAPSMSALSWLETSIRSYAKFVEVASKQASSGQDEAEFVRRERMQVGEIRGILEEMRAASG